MRAEKLMWSSVLGLLAAACGGDDDGGGGGSRPQSYQAIAESIASPSGTVDESTVGDIGEEFEKISAAPAGGVRDDQVAQSNTYTQECTGGGSISVNASGNESAANISYAYNNCCEAGCCMDGSGTAYYSEATSADFTFCGSYDLDMTCDGSSTSVDFSGCVGSDFQWSYLITVDGESYAVSGSYSDGDGTLEIRGANGTWTCTYTDGSGSCTGTGSTSGSFTFSG